MNYISIYLDFVSSKNFFFQYESLTPLLLKVLLDIFNTNVIDMYL